MSDYWENFPCTMGDKPAFISYDHGISKEFEQLNHANFAGFRVSLLDSNESGFPVAEEFAKLNDVEDFLCHSFGADQGVQIGRITSNGYRYFYFYTSLDQLRSEEIASEASKIHGHQIELIYELDLERVRYWNELYPTEDDWRVIKDMRVHELLKEKGDSLTTPRHIDHWAYFDSCDQRDAFVNSVKSDFEQIEFGEIQNEEGIRYSVRLSHTGLPDYRSMNTITLKLARASRQYGGDYDGWETMVCADEDCG
ncbi:DUF695 domain-containing protein [Undibacterium cyanobacteriorum]|uniref:DUF695 domain-containing protein n=1 Tax=Undibacterium cyanobacteriorum TaxID=3073561 RepID=A0ABY9RFJ3_9BURK|nr:DUF695 domain-containing protein [Undibacterium sp. 20NA77.5]WMW79618.1 DUF695 domain-containing protein [Undibacterium sp. 20NA77.5]